MAISGNPTMEGVTLTTNTLKDAYEAENDAAAPVFIPSVRPMNFGTAGREMHTYVMNHSQGFRLDVTPTSTSAPDTPGRAGPAAPGPAWRTRPAAPAGGR